MWNIVRNIIIVTLLTVLVWLFAEGESLRAVQVQTDMVLTAEPASDRVIDLIEPGLTSAARATVLVEIEGSNAATDGAERTLRKPLKIIPGIAGVPLEKGEHSLNLREVVRQHPEVRGRGITIKRVEPATLRVYVDQIETRSVKVIASVSADELEGAAELRPSMATVRLPSRFAAKLSETSSATARISPESLASLTRGRRQTLTGVPIVLPQEVAEDPHTLLEQTRADVTLTLRTRTRSIKIASVPVHVRIAPGELANWDIDIPEQDRFLVDVTLSGPGEAIQAIEDKTVQVIATLPLSFEELERQIPSKEVIFADLPAGVRAEAINRTVRLTITRRAPETRQPVP
ncbi:MAG: hypothetical protein KF859_03105 [Phycisphaeraceae bacterium]|nr:hypothetical protein [Phycisphaeraceae bacterium]